YRENRRDLPWRQTRDPYAIWVSEVILQQTRVEQGLPYYQRFMQAFPCLSDLAGARTSEVLGLWQGLGYYSRARNMHQAAMQVMERYGGAMPSDYASLIALKGVGEYTAAAVASMSSSEAVPVVDGNVIRVLARLHGLEDDPGRAGMRRRLAELMKELMLGHDPGEMNQAVMEFGALQCVPRAPRCGDCPLSHHCKALALDRVEVLPFRRPAKTPRERHINYIVLTDPSSPRDLFLRKQDHQGIWKDLWTFPMVESPVAIQEEELSANPDFHRLMQGVEYHRPSLVLCLRHILSHQRLEACFFSVGLKHPSSTLPQELLRFSPGKLPPMPRLMHRYLEKGTGQGPARKP
ncbi:MAG TPA: A/G-specific adenine glycosylase, partial [Bacteroidales bacterium]|nr:A/G-specific adenine glycosylase [Bacteroidales bacterium]